jgi:four helix bundle protein
MYPFERLEVWRLAVALIKEVYLLAGRLPRSETVGLSDQLRRSAVSVALNIAEGRAADSDAEFHRFVGIALRSLVEVQAAIRICAELQLVTPTAAGRAVGQTDIIEAKLRTLKKTLSRSHVRRDASGVKRHASSKGA